MSLQSLEQSLIEGISAAADEAELESLRVSALGKKGTISERMKTLADMSPEEIVSCIDFRYISDALSPSEAIELLERQVRTKGERESELLASGYPAYTTSVGWFGYSDERIRGLCREALADGWTHFKVKVGGSPDDDDRRVGLVRREIGAENRLMIDANQRWDVGEAIDRVRLLSRRGICAPDAIATT